MRRLFFALKAILATVVGIGLANLIARRPRLSDSSFFKGIALSHDLALQIDFGEPVWMRIDQTAHYRADTDEGGEEFAKLVPRGGHTVPIKDAETGESRISTRWRSFTSSSAWALSVTTTQKCAPRRQSLVTA
ncbi:uncharacterized protein HD556DRAFT_1460968 [Suillus plorans]|uniref:Uncharacterized protein n=1 Tax=Suillus plorans TaxID=116603 RepID=A0A9P7AB83_9AGAM|nr:uncharacterized protein HD556DRAFT_1460968 [Suillus plorans]KAG1784955.1 hypothetical protein HD556DRAFT_1460968 [Suillus plorans]